MKSLLFLVMAFFASIGLIGCGGENIAPEIEEGTGSEIVDTIVTGTEIHENTTNEPSVEKNDEMTIKITNSQVDGYLGEKVKGTNVSMALQYIEVLNENDTFPVPLAINFEDGLTKENIKPTENYKVEAKDNLPKGNTDGYYDVIVISKVK